MNTWERLQQLRERERLDAALRLADAERNLKKLEEQGALFQHHADLTAQRSRQWMDTKKGCPVFLLQSADLFADSLARATQIQTERAEHARQFSEQRAQEWQDAGLRCRQSDMLLERMRLRAKALEQRRERKEQDAAGQRRKGLPQ